MITSEPAIVFQAGSGFGNPFEALFPGIEEDEPLTRTLTSEAYKNSANRISTGTWECDPCEWSRMEMGARAEFFHVLSGSIIIQQDGGEPMEAPAGTSVYSPPFWSGQWRVPERLTKVFFSVDLPNAQPQS